MNVRVIFICLLASAVPAGAAEYRHSVGVGALGLFRAGVSAAVSVPADPSTAPKTDRNYANGYNRVDSSGNLGEGGSGLPSRTSNFGFVSDDQVDLGRGTLSLSTVTPGDPAYVNDESLDASAGVEMHYRVVREVGDWRRFGLELRAGYVDLEFAGTGDLPGSMRVLTDAYQLGGVVPQPAPYSGSFTVQPGTQRIGDIPTRTISSIPATVQGTRSFSVEGWLLRLGVVWVPVSTARMELQVHAGPAALNVDGALRLDERWVASGRPTYTHTADTSRSKWLKGVYAGAAGRMNLSDRWQVFAGVDILNADTLKVQAAAVAAKFDFSKVVVGSAGVAYRF